VLNRGLAILTQLAMPRVITVTAPSRLHFGLFGLQQEEGRMFGGVGAMVDQSALTLNVVPSERLEFTGRLADRSQEFARRWAVFHHLAELPRCRIEVIGAPHNHVGLGVGTQLGLSVAAGLNAFAGLPAAGPQDLALSVGRGQRSAIGTYGFVMGGLIVERGKLPGEPISPLDCRIDLPEQWRFVLLRPVGWQGLSGEQEEQAIGGLPRVPEEVTARLIAIARDELIPAAATANFPQFAESLYQFGHLAGSCFAARQGGPYNGPVLTRLIEWLRSRGYVGVGQSSWGPTLFAAVPDQHSAIVLADLLQQSHPEGPLEVTIAAPNNRGALVQSALGEVSGTEDSD
jgi:beta-ribofuranosylaminobenzene 5'-phosphate synthase